MRGQMALPITRDGATEPWHGGGVEDDRSRGQLRQQTYPGGTQSLQGVHWKIKSFLNSRKHKQTDKLFKGASLIGRYGRLFGYGTFFFLNNSLSRAIWLSEYEVALLLVGPDTRIIAEFELYQTDVSFCSRMLSLLAPCQPFLKFPKLRGEWLIRKAAVKAFLQSLGT